MPDNINQQKLIRIYIVASAAIILCLLAVMIYVCVTLYQTQKGLASVNKAIQANNTSTQMLVNKLGDED